jgi:hypothetical protein
MALSGMATAPSLARDGQIGLFCLKIRGRLRAMRNLWLAALTTLVACSSTSEPLPPPDVHLLVGQEAETWTADPAPTRLQIELVESTRRRVVGETAAPASVITIKNPVFDPGTIASFEATGLDAEDKPIVRGASVRYVLYSLLSATIPIFVARSPSWSRPPGNLEHARNFPVALTVWHQYIIAAGGDVKDASPAIPDVYDGINWKAQETQPPFPRAPKSMLIVGTTLLCIDDSGATWLDLYDDRKANEPAPAGLTFAEIAGGDVFELADGSSYVVGATRVTGDPTSKVLRVDKNGVLKSITLAVPRRGAAAGVVGGNLVVWGGSAEGPGAEVLTKAEDAFSPLPYAADPTTGLGLATFDGTTALLAGGKDPMTGTAAPFRTFDVTCTDGCAAAELAQGAAPLQRTHVFPLAAGNLLVTGDSDDGEFHAFSVATASGTPEITERPLRERRKAATSLLLPNGQPGVLGGENPETGAPVLSIETFFF